MSSQPQLNVVVVSQTASTVTVGWSPLPDCGYRFSVDREVKSHTWDETRSSARFAKVLDGKPHEYGVEPITIGQREWVSV